MDTKILIGIGILGIICIVLMSGCISEKSEEVGIVSPTEENQSAEKPKVKNEDDSNMDETGENQSAEKPTTKEKTVIKYCALECLERSCYEGCYKKIGNIYNGIKKEGISYCDSIVDRPDEYDFPYRIVDDKMVCISLFAASKKDVSLCEKISNKYRKDRCIDWVDGTKKEDLEIEIP